MSDPRKDGKGGRPVLNAHGKPNKTTWVWTCGSCGMSTYLPAPDVLRERRESTGLSLRDFAIKAKVSPTMVSFVERGISRPTPEYLRILTRLESRAKGGDGWSRTT